MAKNNEQNIDINPQDLDPHNPEKKVIRKGQIISNKIQGWVKFENNNFGKYQVQDSRMSDEGKLNSQVEFRIPVFPSEDNINKASKVLLDLFAEGNLKTPKLAKIVDIKKLTEKNYNDWNPEVGEDRRHDQRGKELCFYVTWEKGKDGNLQPSLSGDEYKKFMLTALKTLINAGVEGVGYYHAKEPDRGLNDPIKGANLPQIFTYLDFTTTDYSTFKHKEKYESAGYKDPLENIKITPEDYKNAGITAEHLTKIKQTQQNYLLDNFPKVYESYRTELETGLKNSSANKPWLNQLENKISKLNESKGKALDSLSELATLFKQQRSDLSIRGLDIVEGLRRECEKNPKITIKDLMKKNSQALELLINLPQAFTHKIEAQSNIIATFNRDIPIEKIKTLGKNNPTMLNKLSNTAKHLIHEETAYLNIPSHIRFNKLKEQTEGIEYSARTLAATITALSQNQSQNKPAYIANPAKILDSLTNLEKLSHNIDFKANSTIDIKRIIDLESSLSNLEENLKSTGKSLKSSLRNYDKVSQKTTETNKEIQNLQAEKELIIKKSGLNSMKEALVELDKKIMEKGKSLISDLELKSFIATEINENKIALPSIVNQIKVISNNFFKELKSQARPVFNISSHRLKENPANDGFNKQTIEQKTPLLKSILKTVGMKKDKPGQKISFNEKVEVKVINQAGVSNIKVEALTKEGKEKKLEKINKNIPALKIQEPIIQPKNIETEQKVVNPIPNYDPHYKKVKSNLTFSSHQEVKNNINVQNLDAEKKNMALSIGKAINNFITSKEPQKKLATRPRSNVVNPRLTGKRGDSPSF